MEQVATCSRIDTGGTEFSTTRTYKQLQEESVGIATGAMMTMGVAVFFALLGVRLTRRHLRHHVQEGHNDVLVPIFLNAGVLYAVLLGFLVIGVWEAYSAARENVATEATSLISVYRFTQAMEKDESVTQQRLLRAYTEAVIQEEWVTQADGGKASPRARKAIGDTIREYGKMPAAIRNAHPTINQAYISAIQTLVAVRNKRLVEASDSLPWVLWMVATVGAVVLIAMTFMLFMEKGWPHAVMASLMGLVIGTLLFSMLMLDKPFSGPMAIDSAPFENTMQAFDAVDQGF